MYPAVGYSAKQSEVLRVLGKGDLYWLGLRKEALASRGLPKAASEIELVMEEITNV